METPIRFRNHISIVAERMVRGLVFLGALLAGNLSQNLPGLLEDAGHISENLPAFAAGLAGIFVLFLILVLWQVMIWSKTYISICENTLVIERNTMNRMKYTIAASSISNVNMEQNLFEMLIGTSKLKLDTNSLSTANKTDVQILLKTAQAEALKQHLMSMMHQDAPAPQPEAAKEAAAMPDAPASFDSHADFGDILVHGFFSISLFSLLILVLSIAGAVFSIREAIFSGSTEGLAGFLVSFLVIFGLFASSFWDIARGFIQYYNFRVRRLEDRLYIQYGLLRKVSYTVPVDKIQALKINQTLSARIGGRYMAEIINIGMGDEGNDRNSFLVLYCRKDTLLKRLSSLLPEFADSLELDVQRQPARVWAVWLIPFGIAGLLLGFLSWSLYWFQILTAFWCIAAPLLMAGGCLLLMILRYLTCGCALKEDYVLAVNGYLGRRVTMAAYHQIQYVELKQNPLAMLLHLQKGRLHLLAGAGNQIHDLPYFSSKKIDFFRRRLLHSKEQRGYTNPINEKGEQA